MTKKEFRQFAIKKRNSLSSEERISFSNQILQHLINSEIYQDSKKIFMYLSFQSEVDTFQLLSRALQDNKEVYAPITLPAEKKLLCGRVEDPDRDLEKDFYGILSPILQDNNILIFMDIAWGMAVDITIVSFPRYLKTLKSLLLHLKNKSIRISRKRITTSKCSTS